MTRTRIAGFFTRLNYCSRLDPVTGARDLISLIEQVGGRFLNIAGQAIDPDPHSSIDRQGNILISCAAHPCLAEEPIEREYRFGGTTVLSFIREDRTLHIGQLAGFYEMDRSELVAQGQLALARLLWPHLQPKIRLDR